LPSVGEREIDDDDVAAPALAGPHRFSPLSRRGMLSSMKVREVLKLLQADGWYRAPARGGHRQPVHAPDQARPG
jgi:hypothetical protein